MKCCALNRECCGVPACSGVRSFHPAGGIKGCSFVGALKCQTEVYCCRRPHEDPTALWGSCGADWSPPGGRPWHMWFFMPRLRAAPSSLGFSLLTDQGWAGTGAFLAMLLFIYEVGDTKSQQSVNCGFRVCFSAGAEYISAFSLYSC